MQGNSRRIGTELIGITNSLRRVAVDPRLQQTDSRLTSMQTMLLSYLHEHEDRDVYQKDLEKLFRIRRSTATGILQVLERDGYLIRRPAPQDARMKRLLLTAKGHRACEDANRRVEEMEQIMRGGMTPQELDQLFELLERIKINIAEWS